VDHTFGVSVRRWAGARLDPAALQQLTSELPGAELSSLLLTIMEARANARSPHDVLAQYRRDPFCAPCSGDLRESLAVDLRLLDVAAERFEAIQLSPVAPLGACSSVAPTSQNRILSALRMTEVVSDPTNVLALECALRLRARPSDAVHLSTIQRVIRTQPVPKQPGFSQHFRLFALASGGAEKPAHAFTIEAIKCHIQTMGRALDQLESNGYSFGRRRIEILTTAEKHAVGDRIAEELGGQAQRDQLDHAYYSGGIRYRMWATASDGAEMFLIDGAAFDWLEKLCSNQRAVYVASGAGAQLIEQRFRRPA
jgi:hypothetical protein